MIRSTTKNVKIRLRKKKHWKERRYAARWEISEWWHCRCVYTWFETDSIKFHIIRYSIGICFTRMGMDDALLTPKLWDNDPTVRYNIFFRLNVGQCHTCSTSLFHFWSIRRAWRRFTNVVAIYHGWTVACTISEKRIHVRCSENTINTTCMQKRGYLWKQRKGYSVECPKRTSSDIVKICLTTRRSFFLPLEAYS